MKKIIALLSISLLLITACQKEELDENVVIPDEIPFTGEWSRSFEAGPGNTHNASYKIYNDSIRYTIAGTFVNSDYVMLRDTFLLENNRFIGHTESNVYYLIFVKDVSSSSITVYKQEVASVEEGMSIEVPAANTNENYGWTTFDL